MRYRWNYDDIISENSSKSITATSIINSELWYYQIQATGNTTNIVLSIKSATNLSLKFATLYANNTFANVVTVNNKDSLNQAVSTNDKYVLFAIPNSISSGTLAFDVSSSSVSSSNQSTSDGTSYGLVNTDNVAFLIWFISTIIIWIIFAVFFRKFVKYINTRFPYEQVEEEVPKCEVKEQDKFDSKRGLAKIDQENHSFDNLEEIKESKIKTPKLSTFGMKRLMERKFNKMSQHSLQHLEIPNLKINIPERDRQMTRQDFNHPIEVSDIKSERSMRNETPMSAFSVKNKPDISFSEKNAPNILLSEKKIQNPWFTSESPKLVTRKIPTHVLSSFKKFINIDDESISN